MDQVDFLNRLDFRFSYGLGGNSPKPGKGGPYNLLSARANSMFGKNSDYKWRDRCGHVQKPDYRINRRVP